MCKLHRHNAFKHVMHDIWVITCLNTKVGKVITDCLFIPTLLELFCCTEFTWESCSSLVLRSNEPDLTSLIWIPVRVAVQNLQMFPAVKLSLKPAILWALRLSAATTWIVPLTHFTKQRNKNYILLKGFYVLKKRMQDTIITILLHIIRFAQDCKVNWRKCRMWAWRQITQSSRFHKGFCNPLREVPKDCSPRNHLCTKLARFSIHPLKENYFPLSVSQEIIYKCSVLQLSHDSDMFCGFQQLHPQHLSQWRAVASSSV